MERLNVEKNDDQVVLTDFPDSKKVIKLEGEKAQILSDMSLHKSDLVRAKEYLQLYDNAEAHSLLKEGLWKIAIITFIKCFTKNNARTLKLEISKIFPENDLVQNVIYPYFLNIRDKNIVHDDNAITQCGVGAVLNNIDSEKKIEKIVTANVYGLTDGPGNVNNLKNLITDTLEYVDKCYDDLAEVLTEELENRSHAELSKFDILAYRAPEIEEYSKTRKKL